MLPAVALIRTSPTTELNEVPVLVNVVWAPSDADIFTLLLPETIAQCVLAPAEEVKVIATS
jgi:hypothetical protein